MGSRLVIFSGAVPSAPVLGTLLSSLASSAQGKTTECQARDVAQWENVNLVCRSLFPGTMWLQPASFSYLLLGRRAAVLRGHPQGCGGSHWGHLNPCTVALASPFYFHGDHTAVLSHIYGPMGCFELSSGTGALLLEQCP